MYNQTSCLLTQPCLPQRQQFEGKIIILMGMMSQYAAEATLSSPADKKKETLHSQTPLLLRSNWDAVIINMKKFLFIVNSFIYLLNDSKAATPEC